MLSEKDKIQVPGDVAAVVEGLKRSTENTLNLQISRLDVEVPPSYQLGVEGQKKQGRLLDDKIASDDRVEVARGDRELARIYVEMLQPIAEGLVVAFRTRRLANAARKTWKLDPTEGAIVSFPEKAKGAFAEEVKGPTQFRRQLRELNCQCLIVVGPYLDQLRLVNDLGKDVSDSMGIILLNARIHGDRTTIKIPPKLKRELQETFAPSYHIRFLPEKKNSILFSMVGPDGGAPWIVAQQRELIGGQPVTDEVLRAGKEPSAERIMEAFTEYESRERSTTDKLLDIVDKENIKNWRKDIR